MGSSGGLPLHRDPLGSSKGILCSLDSVSNLADLEDSRAEAQLVPVVEFPIPSAGVLLWDGGEHVLFSIQTTLCLLAILMQRAEPLPLPLNYFYFIFWGAKEGALL